MSAGVPKRPSGVAASRLLGDVGIGMAGLGHRRVDETRMHRVHADLVRRVLDRGGLGEDAHRALRGVIGGVGVRADDAADRRDVDDRAAAGALHGRDGGLGAEEDAGRVDLHDPVPLLERLVGQPRPGGDGWSGCSASDRGRRCRRCCTGCRAGRRLFSACATIAAHCGFVAHILVGERRVPPPSAISFSTRLAEGRVAVGQQHRWRRAGANRRAVSAPMPDAPPVTIATLPEKSLARLHGSSPRFL